MIVHFIITLRQQQRMSSSLAIITFHVLLLLFLLKIDLVHSSLLQPDSENSYNHLKKFELIRLSDLDLHHSHTKRDTTNEPTALGHKRISFRSFGRDFHLILEPSHSILANDFRVFSLNGRGEKTPFQLHLNEFFRGRLFGRLNTQVSAHIDSETGLMTAAIYDHHQRETYFIEPAEQMFSKSVWNNNLNNQNDTMIIYRPEDVPSPPSSMDYHHEQQTNFTNQNNHNGYCDFIKIDDHPNDTVKIVSKRQIYYDSFWDEKKLEPKKCSLRLIADYTFYEEMGNSDLKKTINLLINLIQRVDEIFSKTEWKYSQSDSEVYQDYGFMIQEILVHESPFENYEQSLHYNMRKERWIVRDLLETFSRSSSHRSFCLSHLFTHRTFDNGILGLAYVSSPRKYSYGGVCSPPYHKDGHFYYLNTGLTSTRNSFGHRVIMRQAVLITAHELGHNWGAEHDPSVAECTPRSSKGGAYIMNTFSVSSYDPNNQFFSICSRRSIKAVLKSKSMDCFSKPKPTFCGNGVVEQGEQCDPGLASGENGDPCCTNQCKLKFGAQCSDRNSPCCENCEYTHVRFQCRDSNDYDCKSAAYCNGSSSECPPSDSQPDRTTCMEDGQCRAGRCLPFCEKHNKISCMCEQSDLACMKCCRDTPEDQCQPWQQPFSRLKDGTPCMRGYCSAGKCLQMAQDYVERFWHLIDDIQIDSFQQFLKDNLVGCVIIVSIIVFVPACYYIEKYDQKTSEKYRARLEQQHKLLQQQQQRAREAQLQQRSFGGPTSTTTKHAFRPNRTSFARQPSRFNSRGRIHQINELSPYQLYDSQPQLPQHQL